MFLACETGHDVTTFMLESRPTLVQSLAVSPAAKEGISRITTVVPGRDESISKLVQQLYKLIDILEVKNI
ncbi:hypothetical protein ACLOJK_018585 [Asimina triloba]